MVSPRATIKKQTKTKKLKETERPYQSIYLMQKKTVQEKQWQET